MGVNDRKQSEREARKEQRKAEARGVAPWRGYINLDLSRDDKEQFEAWVHTGEAWEVLAACVDAGYVVSLKANPNGGGSLASVTQRAAGHVNAGLCVTARGGTADVALFRVMFLVLRLTVEGSWEDVAPVSDPDRW